MRRALPFDTDWHVRLGVAAASARTGKNAMSCSMACCGEAGWRMNRARC